MLNAERRRARERPYLEPFCSLSCSHLLSKVSNSMSITPAHPHCLPHASRPPLHYNSPAGRAASGRWFLLNSIPLTSIIGTGALLQYGYTLALAYIPMSTGAALGAWCALPLAMILGPFIKPTLQTFGLLRNPWMEEVIPGKTYAHLPGGIEDEEGVRQSPEFAVLLIGARCNAPFGAFSGGKFAEIGKGFSQVSFCRAGRP